MTSPLAGSLARTIGRAFRKIFLDATLTRMTHGTGPAYDPAPGIPVSYPCKAIRDEWSSYDLANSLVEANECKILILAASLAAKPVSGDRITLDGETFTISGQTAGKPAVTIDPAKAVWEVRALV